MAALGALWCVLGLALGLTLTVRLGALRNDAEALAASRLPSVMAVQKLDEQIARTSWLANRLVAEHATDMASRFDTARKLSDATVALETALRGFDPEFLSVGHRAIGHAASRSAEVVLVESRSLLGTSHEDLIEDLAILQVISRESEEADQILEQLSERNLTPAISKLARQLQTQANRAVLETLFAGTAAITLGAVLTVMVAIRVRRREFEQRMDRLRQDFQSRIADAFNMATDEESAFHLMEQVVSSVLPDTPTEMLLADSSRAHFNRVASTEGTSSEEPMCSVRAPSLCPAVRRGVPLSFEDSDAFDACPHLRGRPGGSCSATCVPLSVMGQHVGVIHAVTPPHHTLDTLSRERLTVLASKSGERIGILRAFAQSEQQAARDPLTGLLNRRSAEAEVQRLQRSGTPFCVAFADIDCFKQLNDTHGHETGDKALRLFSRVVRESLRPSDVVARWGGEEFVILLPNLDLAAARVALDRVRCATEESTGAGSVPHFTVSVGVTRCEPDDDFFERLDEADAALLAAKGAGRNRVTISESALTMKHREPRPSDAPALTSPRAIRSDLNRGVHDAAESPATKAA
ncbi:MAG: diguanylate cyclase [Phycisphaeraceae bacterium]|nr:diguanylate cyclase [Phycisphaeraceae bacterium]